MKILLLLNILCMTSLMYGFCSLKDQIVTKAINKFGQSNFINLYSKCVQMKIDRCMSYGDEPASKKYQNLGLEAQKTLGIAHELQLPIKKIKGKSTIPAVAGSDAIYVNEDVFKNKSFGAQRFAMFHESVHVKYHDAAVLGLLKIIGFSTGSIGMYEVLEVCNIDMLHKSFSVLAGIVSSLGLSFKYRQFMERRADIQACQAIGCASCVQEEIEQRTNMFESAQKASFDNMPECQKQKVQEAMQKHYGDKDPTEILETFECYQGYLRRSELKQIKQDLADKKCAYHLEQQK